MKALIGIILAAALILPSIGSAVTFENNGNGLKTCWVAGGIKFCR